jgi:DNA invertase Pin-like site-specific DNA recombinase
MPRAVAYLRVSTDDQAESGNGLNAQRDGCAAYASRLGLVLVGPFADEGVSGAAAIDKRPALMEALAEIGKGDVLLVAKRDRLGRDPFVVAMIEAAVKRSGGRVVSVAGEGTDGDGPTDVLMRRIVDAFGEYERLVIKARTKAALGAKKRRGERVGTVPLGYDLADDGRRSKEGKPLALVANAGELLALDTIRQLAASGLGPRGIAREMTARGIPTKGGKPTWSHTTILRILSRLGDPPPALSPFEPIETPQPPGSPHHAPEDAS